MLFDFLRDRETIKGLRKELGEVRRELERKDTKLWQKDRVLANWRRWAASGGSGTYWQVPKGHSVAHFDLTEPRIARREHSDVFKIDSIEALIAGSR